MREMCLCVKKSEGTMNAPVQWIYDNKNEKN
jgi:hypothetical protein